ncbi:MAG: hypothetical protein JSW11_17590 [Candidatus Heimdallarchaeota archaeon]|nr:MAG: hypothetical protein JSW11_17590 [Candidatus Heimdallarchaeota archaeon]
MSVFDEARTEWSRISTKNKWASSVFGETYFARYPLEAGTAEAVTYKASIYKGDDSVHAWDARGVRQKIIQRIIETQERTIRPWYGEISFFADQTKLLPPLPESELDFILRTSLQSKDEKFTQFKAAREELLKHLDPDLDQEQEERRIFIQTSSPEVMAKRFSHVQIELYGLLNVIKTKMFVLSDDEIKEIIDLVLDIEQSDKFLVKRFIEPNMREEDMRPFIGKDNPEVKLKLNFPLKYVAGGDSEYYKFRVFQLWLRNLLDFDKQASSHIENLKSDLFKGFSDEEAIKRTLFQAIKLYRWESHKERFSATLKTDYASKLDFKGFTSEVIHLINSRNDLFSELTDESFLLPITLSNYDSTKICHDLGLEMMESVLEYLSNQIPEPEGVGGRIQSRLIMNKRINNMKKYVLTEEIRDEILQTVSIMHENIGTDKEHLVEDAIREPHKRLLPRGEHYFDEMKTEVETVMREMGDQDLRKELAASTDDPQTLVKQYGTQAVGMVGRDAEITYLYSTILGLKSAEIIFSGSTTLTPMKRQKVTNSLINDVIHPQFNFLSLIKKEEEREESKED